MGRPEPLPWMRLALLVLARGRRFFRNFLLLPVLDLAPELADTAADSLTDVTYARSAEEHDEDRQDYE